MDSQGDPRPPSERGERGEMMAYFLVHNGLSCQEKDQDCELWRQKFIVVKAERDTLLIECRRFEGEYLEAMKDMSHVFQERDRYKEALERIAYGEPHGGDNTD